MKTWHFGAALSALSLPALLGSAARGDSAIETAARGDAELLGEPSVPVALHFGDVDADGLDDALAIETSGRVTLFSNLGDGRFEDITLESGLSLLGGASCAAFADFDGDGDVDLFAGSSETRLWRNVGHALFEPLASGVDHDQIDLSAEPVDFDADGLLDLAIQSESGALLYRNVGLACFEEVDLVGAGAEVTALAVERTAPDATHGSASPEETPAGRRILRWSQGLTQAVDAGSRAHGAGSEELAGSAGSKAGSGCSATIADAITGNCMSASVTPQVGRLYPLSSKLFVGATGKVGMGTTAPVAGLQVESTHGLLATGVVGSGVIPATGPGTRMMWYPRKAAFRAGNVDGSQWDAAKVGDFSTALGRNTTASGNFSTALGGGTTANGNFSTSLGLNTKVQSFAGAAFGRNNVGGGSASAWVGTDPLLEVGNGDFGAPSNALTVLKNGNVGLGTATPGFQLQLSLDSAAKPSSNTWTISSDERLKKNVSPLRGALDRLLALRGVTFDWIDPASHGGCDWQQIGLIAQEVERVFPHWVGLDAEGFKTLTVAGFEALTVESLRTLKTQVDELRRHNAELEARVARLESIQAELEELRALVRTPTEAR